jgi:outer membrane protein OmpA-like peptidoglycan-associated protein
MPYLKPLLIIQLTVIINYPAMLWANPCDSLLKQAYKLGKQPAEQKRLLQRALNLCPNLAAAHHNLAVLYEKEHNHNKALYHYQQTLKHDPDYYHAWVGIGDVYYEQNQLPLSLEAYLQACTRHPRARLRIRELLRDNRYRTAKADEVIKHDSLELLYDQKRLQKLYQLAKHCRQQYKSVAATTKTFLKPLAIFRNIRFKTGSARINLISQSQLDEIALTLTNKYTNKTIYIAGHSDIQAWIGETPARSEELNQLLSERRANSVKTALAQRGIPKNKMKTSGYGTSRPLVQGNTETAWSKNRRVEIEVRD